MPVTVLDIIVAVVVLISAILAMVRGFVREVLSIASWVAAAGAAYLFYKPIVPVVQPYFESKTVAVIVSAAAIFFVALIIASYITMKIADFVIDSRIGAIDRLLGFGFGAVRGILIAVVAVLFFNWLVPKPPPWVSEARTLPALTNLGDKLMAQLPPDAEEWLTKKLGHGGSSGGSGTASGGTPAGGTETDTGANDQGDNGDNNTGDTTDQQAPNYDTGGVGKIIDNNPGNGQGGNDQGGDNTDAEGGAKLPAN